MAKINENYRKLRGSYLFFEIKKKANEFAQKNPGIKVMSLGIGDTTEPITPMVLGGFRFAIDKLAKAETYTGYGDEQGDKRLREALVDYYKEMGIDFDISEFFVSDGAKSDSANIQSIFSQDSVVAIQNPSYPVYVDTNVIAGRGGEFNEREQQYSKLVYMPCLEENNFFPKIPKQKVDLIYLCFPNNPTGTVATREQLQEFVGYAINNKAVIVFDAAYSVFISGDNVLRSIYEIKEAKKCAIEINSFSKMAGFTGVRLGWTIVPKDLILEGSMNGELNSFWLRRQTTFFNGASNIAQEGGLTALTQEGQKESKQLVNYYMENAKLIKHGLQSVGLTVYGGDHAPYLWIKTPNNMKSWDFFDKLLQETFVVGTPGSGFGSYGEGFLRLSAFGHRENIERAVESIKNNLKI